MVFAESCKKWTEYGLSIINSWTEHAQYTAFQVACLTRICACANFQFKIHARILVAILDNRPEMQCSLITLRAHARARGYVIGRGVYILLYIISLDFFLEPIFYLQKYSL